MTTVVAFVSQKGGVGKSSLSRALAREAAASGLSVKVADLDADQGTIVDWQRARVQRGIEPKIAVELFYTVADALKEAKRYDLYVVDSAGRATAATLEVARKVHLLVQPTGGSLDDLAPAVRVFHALVKSGISSSKLVFALNRIASDNEADASRAYLTDAGYEVLPGFVPERRGYRLAQNEGRALTETRFAGLREQADAMISALTDKVVSIHGK
jgi:chromosome partitioning protein